MIDYKMLGVGILKRRDEIAKKIKAPISTYGIEFMGRYQDIPVIEVRIEFPVYRLANIRTRTFQREYLATHKDANKNLFSNDHDAVAAQSAQHEILLLLAEEENLFKTFKNDKLFQTEPIICSHDGIVVNGNRRLCVWRELYSSGKEDFRHLETIRIAVLPQCDERAIVDLEKRLQIQNQMKADYHWHCIADDAKDEIRKGTPIGEVASSMGKSSVSMRTMIDARDYAEQYLKYIGKPDQWSQVDKSEYAFTEMVKGRKKLSTEGEKALFEALAFKYIESGSSDGRLYEIIPAIVDHIQAIASELAKKVLPQEEEPRQDEALDILTGGDEVVVDLASKVAPVVKGMDDDQELQKTVLNVIEVEKELLRDKKQQNFLLIQLSKAATALQSAIENGIVDREVNLEGIEKQLNAINEKVQYIKDWYEKQK